MLRTHRGYFFHKSLEILVISKCYRGNYSNSKSQIVKILLTIGSNHDAINFKMCLTAYMGYYYNKIVIKHFDHLYL